MNCIKQKVTRKSGFFNKTVVVLSTTAHHYGVPHPSSAKLDYKLEIARITKSISLFSNS